MPQWIDPAWEYWAPGPEWSEAFAEESSTQFDPWGEARRYDAKSDKLGFRFGHGNPNAFLGRLAPAKPERAPRVARPARHCQECGYLLDPTRDERRYCSRKCGSGAEKVLATAARCERCKAAFKPRYAGHRFCSRRCGSHLGAPAKPGSDRLAVFAARYKAGERMEDIGEKLGVSLPTLKRWRRELGLKPRQAGNHSHSRRV